MLTCGHTCAVIPVHRDDLATVLTKWLTQGRPLEEVIAAAASRVADAAAVARKNEYYLELMNNWLAEHPDDWETYFRVGHGLFVTGEREAAHS